MEEGLLQVGSRSLKEVMARPGRVSDREGLMVEAGRVAEAGQCTHEQVAVSVVSETRLGEAGPLISKLHQLDSAEGAVGSAALPSLQLYKHCDEVLEVIAIDSGTLKFIRLI